MVEFILTPLAVGMLLQSRVPAFSAASQPVFAKLGNISALVLLALLVVLHFRDLLGVVGSGAIAISAVFMRDRLKVVFPTSM